MMNYTGIIDAAYDFMGKNFTPARLTMAATVLTALAAGLSAMAMAMPAETPIAKAVDKIDPPKTSPLPSPQSLTVQTSPLGTSFGPA